MWPFSSKKKVKESGLFEGFTDWHSHVLPGVDDGIKKIEDSLKVIKTYEENGVDTLWCTPHIMEDMPNTTADLRERFEHLKAAYNGSVKLRLASENMLDNLFEERLAANDFLPIGNDGKHLLVETSYFTPPVDLNDKLARVFGAGYFPLLAHPERYMYMDLSDYDDLHSRGVKMQLNLSSLVGYYGKDAQKKAMYMLKNRYYNAVGSDTHRYSQVAKMLDDAKIEKKALGLLLEIRGID